MTTKERKSELMRNWRARNPERQAEHKRRSYAKNREKILENKRKYFAANRERILEKNRQWGKIHGKNHNQSPRGKMAQYRHNAKTRGYEFLLTFDEFMTFWQKPCLYCGDAIKTIGLDRVDSMSGYQMDNVVSCCILCNQAKNDLPQKQFIEQCHKIAQRHARQEIRQ